MNHRPTYIPRNKRQRASMPNHTVYSVGKEDGWTPSSQPLTAHELMDDRDFEEWGGATQLQAEFSARSTVDIQRPSVKAAITDLFTVQLPSKVGDKLLAKLGWRPATGSSIVPDNQASSTHHPQQFTFDNNSFLPTNHLLSKRKLRRIQCQQQRAQIPVPKLDTAGLGFDPHKDAPEFQAYKARMLQKQQQQQRGRNSNVYRIDTVLGASRSRRQLDDDDDLHDTMGSSSSAYPSVPLQDFVGSHSAAGFALHDDDDDHVFDDNAPAEGPGASDKNKPNINADDYDLVAYEPDDDSDASDDQDTRNDMHKPAAAKLASVFGDALRTWAKKTDETQNSSLATSTGTATAAHTLTADGKRPLPGFVVGSNSSNQPFDSKRFRGPDMPQDYFVKRHVFGPNEHPQILQALSHAEKLDAADQQPREQAILDQARIRPHAGRSAAEPIAAPIIHAFSGLSKSMSDRFTSSSSSADAAETKTAVATVPSTITSHRTVHPFYPEPLLCKRFGLPALPKPSGIAATDPLRTREESFFQEHILSKVADTAMTQKKPSTTRKIEPLDEAVTTDPLLLVERPAMEVFKSIFMAASDEDESSEEEGNDDGNVQQPTIDDGAESKAFVGSDQQIVSYVHVPLASDMDDPQAVVTYNERSKKIKRGHAVASDDSSADRADTKDNTRRREHKHRKKHSKHKKAKKHSRTKE